MDIKPDNWLLTRRRESDLKRAGDIEHARGMEHSLSLIDFGRAIDLSVFSQNGSGTVFKGKCCASSFSCPAMTEVSDGLTTPKFSLQCIHLSHLFYSQYFCFWENHRHKLTVALIACRNQGRAWKYDADLFALGSCVYFMLHGMYLEVSCVQDADSAFTRSGRRWRPVKSCKRCDFVSIGSVTTGALL